MVASFPKACYVALPGGLVSLVAPDVFAGPVHVVVDEVLAMVEPRAPARVDAGRLEIGPHSVDLTGAREWRGRLPPASAVRAAADGIVGASEPGPRSALLEDPYRSRGALARACLADGDLVEAARLLVGLGPGLTPSGDDTLAGVLFAIRAAEGRDGEAITLGIAELGETGEISRAFLRWAARGQSLAPAHALLASAAAGDQAGAVRAAGTMAGVGETSGADFLLGLGWGLEAAVSGSAPRPPTGADRGRHDASPTPPT